MLKEHFVGRQKELQSFRDIENLPMASFVAVYGRRRVGKTLLIREATKNRLALEMTGLRDGNLSDQLDNFRIALSKAASGAFPLKPPKSWREAFQELEAWGTTLPKTKKHFLFFDELPWLAGPRARFLPALDYFWNTWGSRQPHIILVVCWVRSIVDDPPSPARQGRVAQPSHPSGST